MTERNAAQVRQDTGAPLTVLARHAVAIGTHRWGGIDVDTAARRYDVERETMRRALEGLVRTGWAMRGEDMGETIYSMGPRLRAARTSVYGYREDD